MQVGGGIGFDSSGLAALGQRAVQMAQDGMGAVAAGAGAVADRMHHAAGDAVGALASRGTELFEQAGKTMEKAHALLPRFSLEGLSGRMGLAHTPPRPQLPGHNVSVRAEVGALFGVRNGGWSATGGVRFGNIKADGSFTVEAGKVPAHQLPTIKDTLRAVFQVGFGGAGRLGFDLAARVANIPVLSVALSSFPLGLSVLGQARSAVAGGFKHLAAFFGGLRPNVNINVKTDINVHVRADVRVHGAPKPPLVVSTTMPAPTRPADPTAPGNNEMSSILNNPNLTFEDKIFLFCLAFAKNKEKEIEAMMGRYNAAKAAASGNPTSGGAPQTGAPPGGAPVPATGGPAAPSGLGGLLAGIGGTLGNNASTVGGIVGVVKNLGVKALNLASNVVPIVLPALVSGAAGLLSAIPVVGSIAGAAVGSIGGVAANLLAKGGLTAAAALLQNLPLEKVAAAGASVAGNVMSSMASRQGTSAPGNPAQAGAQGAGAPATAAKGGGVLDMIKRAGPSGLLALLMFTGEPIGGMIGLVAAGFTAKKMMSGGVAAGPTSTSGPGVPTAGGSTVPGTKFTDDKGTVFDAGDKESENQFMQRLTHNNQELARMYEMVSTLGKSMHDTQMSSIRNMR